MTPAMPWIPPLPAQPAMPAMPWIPPLPALLPLQVLPQATRWVLPQATQRVSSHCVLCNNCDDEAHRAGRQHRALTEEKEMLDMLLGPSRVPRRLSTVASKPYYGALQWSELCSHWGTALAAFPEKVKHVLRSNGGLIKLDKKKPIQLSMEQINNLKFQGGLVPYVGSGKYSPRDLWLPFEAIDGHPNQTHTVPVDAPVWGQGQGWWPTVAVATELGLGVGEQIRVLGGVVCVVCVMQWGWPVPTGWWITVTPLRSML